MNAGLWRVGQGKGLRLVEAGRGWSRLVILFKSSLPHWSLHKKSAISHRCISQFSIYYSRVIFEFRLR
jgi:hypothetical protein